MPIHDFVYSRVSVYNKDDKDWPIVSTFMQKNGRAVDNTDYLALFQLRWRPLNAREIKGQEVTYWDTYGSVEEWGIGKTPELAVAQAFSAVGSHYSREIVYGLPIGKEG